MPDKRQHRGPHPEDRQLFADDALPSLQQATNDLSWLLSRDYAAPSALKVVGDRYRLDARQRVAVARCAGADQAVAARQQREVPPDAVEQQELWIDGLNVLTSLEAALGGGVILLARDGCYRDMASMHGSYRKVDETLPAIELLGQLLGQWQVARCHWLLDQPVSNSGRLKTMLRETAEHRGWDWQIELVPDPDYLLKRSQQIVATSASQILDAAPHWFNLARRAIDMRIEGAWIVDLSVAITSPRIGRGRGDGAGEG